MQLVTLFTIAETILSLENDMAGGDVYFDLLEGDFASVKLGVLSASTMDFFTTTASNPFTQQQQSSYSIVSSLQMKWNAKTIVVL